MIARHCSTSAACSSSDSQFFSHTAPGAIATASWARGNPDSRLDIDSLSCQDFLVIREEPQYYFKCSSCRWFGPLTKDELEKMRVGELGTSRCPRCGQIGFLEPTPPPRTTSAAR